MSDKKEKINIYLFKDCVGELDQAIKQQDELFDDRYLTRHPLSDDVEFNGAIWVKTTQRNEPAWKEFLEKGASNPLDNIYTASASAVLILKTSDRIFGITFGHGRNLIDTNLVVRDFGLKVVLNRVDNEKLRSMDKKSYDDKVISTKVQTSKNSDTTAFGLDIVKDMIRSVAGEARELDLGQFLIGRDALIVCIQVYFDELDDLCSSALDAYYEITYEDHFKWIDHIREIRDKMVIEQLDSKLEEALQQRVLGNMHLASPDVLELEDIEYYVYSGMRNNAEYNQIDINDFISIIHLNQIEVTVEKLKRDYVKYKRSGSAELINLANVYRCIIWETELDDYLYALIEGNWYGIDKSFYDEVRRYIRTIPQSDLSFPAYVGTIHEKDYNIFASTQLADIISLDRVLYKAPDWNKEIEFCDLMSSAGHLIHVKKGFRSSTLSHLFSQGYVSAQSFLLDEKFRSEIKKSIHGAGSKQYKNKITKKRPIAEKYKIVYAIAVKQSADLYEDLPFFSKVNLMQHTKSLLALGFKVQLLHIIKED